MAPVDEKTPPDGLRATSLATQRAVEVLETDVGEQGRRLDVLDRVALPRVVHVVAALLIGIALGVPFGAWLLLLTRVR